MDIWTFLAILLKPPQPLMGLFLLDAITSMIVFQRVHASAVKKIHFESMKRHLRKKSKCTKNSGRF